MTLLIRTLRICAEDLVRTNTLDVYLGDELIGSLTRSGAGSISFDYLAAYRSKGTATPLSCSMPLALAHHPDKVVKPFLWGLLPESELVLNRWSREFHVAATNPMALLSCVGSDLPGGLQMLESGVAPRHDTGEVEWLDVWEVARLLEEVRRDQSAWIATGAKGRWSLAGAQAKIALLEEDGKWGRPTGATPTNRILKPAPADHEGHDINEHLCLNAASNLGLLAARSRVVEFGEQRALCVERYDRVNKTDGTLERIHQEDLCQALSVMPDQKYESEGGPNAHRIASFLNDQVGGPAAGRVVAQFVDALILNWLLCAPDAHAKNYSVLLVQRAVRLAPLYDVASVLPYRGIYEPKIKLAMKVGRHYRVGAIGRSTWERQAISMGLDANIVLARAIDLALRLPDAFADAARSYQAADSDPFVSLLTDKVTARAKRCALALQA